MTANPTIRPDVTKILIKSLAIFNWQPVDAGEVPHLVEFENFGGTLNALGNNPKQIGSGAGEISYMFAGSTIDFSGSTGVISFGAGSSVTRYGGDYIPPSGASLTL